ncbi:hypothetical protein L9F63_020866, partial [Diploptera punctata]
FPERIMSATSANHCRGSAPDWRAMAAYVCKNISNYTGDIISSLSFRNSLIRPLVPYIKMLSLQTSIVLFYKIFFLIPYEILPTPITYPLSLISLSSDM